MARLICHQDRYIAICMESFIKMCLTAKFLFAVATFI